MNLRPCMSLKSQTYITGITSLIFVSFIFIDNKTSVEVDIPEQTQVIKGNRFVSLKKKIVSENHRCNVFFISSVVHVLLQIG